MEKKKKVEVHKDLAIVPSQVSVATLGMAMTEEAERRKLVNKYIKYHMKEGTDFGTITVEGKDGKQYQSKPSLFKPGSEKFLSLFRIMAVFRKDQETWEMAGSKNGLLCYICELKNSAGVIVGEGRGAADIAERSRWTMNNAIKIAQKRAQIDAVLRTGALSDFFTQDIEDDAELREQSGKNAIQYAYSRAKRTVEEAKTVEELEKALKVMKKDLDSISKGKAGALGLSKEQYEELVALGDAKLAAIGEGTVE